MYPDGATRMKEPKEGRRLEKTQIANMSIYIQVRTPVVREDTQRTLTVICDLLEDTGMDKNRIESKGMRI